MNENARQTNGPIDLGTDLEVDWFAESPAGNRVAKLWLLSDDGDAPSPAGNPLRDRGRFLQCDF